MAQSFQTGTVANNSPAFYQLSIRQPGFALAELSTYTFPLSPSQLSYAPNSLSSYTDTQGPAVNLGVTRVIDAYGMSPPMIVIDGTTGWDTHLTDGLILPGLQSMQLLQAFLARYTKLNQAQIQNGKSEMYTLEFYDYFSTKFWAVEPIGPQIIRQSADRPLLTYYRFRWAAYRALALPVLGEADALLQVFGTPPARAVINAASTIGALLTAYSPVGPAQIASKLVNAL